MLIQKFSDGIEFGISEDGILVLGEKEGLILSYNKNGKYKIWDTSIEVAEKLAQVKQAIENFWEKGTI